MRRRLEECPWRTAVSPLLVAVFAVWPGLVAGQDPAGSTAVPTLTQQTCDYSGLPGVVWFGTHREMTIQQLAEYAAPIYWFSPDEPTMDGARGKDIRVPMALPFEPQPDAPVVYYQYNMVTERGDRDGPGFIKDSTNMAASVIDLNNIGTINLKYIAYFPREEGLGGHEHDVEPAEFRLFVFRSTGDAIREFGIECDQLTYILGVARITGEAHGLAWYFNVLEVDEYTEFPFTLLVEEGKHAMCTDKNGDGYFTPGFDVNKRINDAWGIRDIIRQGALFSGGYQAWMAKVRTPAYRVFPPLPDDSPLLPAQLVDGVYAPDNAIYELRPFPSSDEAEGDDLLALKMGEKEERDWPKTQDINSLDEFSNWVDEGLALKPLGIALRASDGLGFAWYFPLFIVKNFEDPMAGGWIVWRMYLQDKDLRDFGWQLLYTPSASRWIDTYFAAGVEWDKETTASGADSTKTDFTMETGLKFRANITKSPLKFMSFLTEFMGVRFGIQNKGFFDINRLTYVIEFGAGVW